MPKSVPFAILIFAVIIGQSRAANYNPGDWVEFTVFRYVTSIAADQEIVYFGTTGGIIRYDRFSQQWLDPLTTSDGLPSNYILKIGYDPAFDELWALTRSGGARYNLTFKHWYIDDNFPGNLATNDWNPAGFSTLFAPFRYSYQGGAITDPYLRTYKIICGWRDNQSDLMFIGTWGLGPGIIDTRHLNLTLLPYGPFNSNISRVIEVSGSLWMGTDYTRADRGLTKFDRDSARWRYFEPGVYLDLGDAELTSAISNSDIVWLGTRGGLVRYEPDESFRTYGDFKGLPSDNVLSLAEYGGFIYVGTDDGLGVIPPGGKIPDSTFKSPLDVESSFSGQAINDLLAFKDKLYIATDRAVYAFDSAKRSIQELDTPAGDLAAGATDIYCFGNSLYFAVKHGVVIVDVGTNVLKLATDAQLADRWHINQLLADSVHIWAATTLGLWRYELADGTTYLYTVGDGLPVNNINSLVREGSYLWLGTNLGLVKFLWNSPGRGD